MTLALSGPASLDQLERWARQYFSAVPNRQAPALVYPTEYLPRQAALRLLRIEPIKDLRQLHLEFPLPGLMDGWPHKSAELLGFAFGSEGPGSLLAQLKAEGLATSLSAGAQSATRQYGAFELQIGLTPQGLNDTNRVLQLVFATAQLWREQGLPPHLFKERQTLARLDERFRDKGEGGNLTAGLASALMDHPLAVAERVPFLWLQEDPAAFKALLSNVTPDNLLVTLVAKGQATDKTEPVYGTPATATPWTAGRPTPPCCSRRAWPRLQLPKANPFVPARNTLRALQPGTPDRHPRRSACTTRRIASSSARRPPTCCATACRAAWPARAPPCCCAFTKPPCARR